MYMNQIPMNSNDSQFNIPLITDPANAPPHINAGYSRRQRSSRPRETQADDKYYTSDTTWTLYSKV